MARAVATGKVGVVAVIDLVLVRGLVVVFGRLRNGCTGGGNTSSRRRGGLASERKNGGICRGRRVVAIATGKVGVFAVVDFVLAKGMGIGVGWLRKGGTSGRNAGPKSRDGSRGSGLSNGRRMVAIAAGKMGVVTVIDLGLTKGMIVGRLRKWGTGRRNTCRRRREAGRGRGLSYGRSNRGFGRRRRMVAIATGKVGGVTAIMIAVVLTKGMIVSVGWLRKWGTGGRNAGPGRREAGRGRGLSNGRSKNGGLGRGRRMVTITTGKVGRGVTVVDLVLAKGLVVVFGRLRKGGTGGRNAGPRRRRGLASERRRGKAPPAIERRDHDGSGKGGKHNCRDDFQMHTVFV